MKDYLKMFTEDTKLKPVNLAVSAKMLDCLKWFQDAMPKNNSNRRATQAEALHVLLAHAFSCKAVQAMLEEKHAADLAEARLVIKKLKDPTLAHLK